MEFIDWENVPFTELEVILLDITRDGGTAMIDQPLGRGLTPLCLACAFKREDLLTILLHHGARADVASLGRFPLHYACLHKGRNQGLVRKLLEAGADVDVEDSDGNSSLNMACSKENIPVVQMLIKHGADINRHFSCATSPLLTACSKSCPELVNILLSAGSDPNCMEGQALKLAIDSEVDSEEIIQLLISAGADHNRWQCLHYACAQENKAVVKILLKNGAEINMCNRFGETPLHTLSRISSKTSSEILHLLLEKGADVSARSVLCHTPMQVACSKHNIDKIKLLLAYGACFKAHIDIFWIFYNRGEECVPTLQLMLAAGSEFPYQLFDIDRKKRMMSCCHKTVSAIIESFASGPLDLQWQCRILIRRLLAPNKDDSADGLPLPRCLIQFLKFSEIE